MISVLDFGLGNIGSIINMLKSLNIAATAISTKSELECASKLILPGVGSFDNGMEKINRSGLRELLDYKVLEKQIPILGICLGMQLMCMSSEEGTEGGLSWLSADVVKFKFSDASIKIPHMGWNEVYPVNANSCFSQSEVNRFYFVHSYYVTTDVSDMVSGVTNYGELDFISEICYENIVAVQFHPEKSHKFGKHLFKQFSAL